MELKTDLFKKICGNYVTGVTVITSKIDEKDFGFTANSFTSVSLDPMLILFCIQKDAKSNEALIEKNRFVISILSENQEEICYRFSDPKLNQIERFENVETFKSKNSIKIISGSIAWIECLVTNKIEAGDHFIFLGEVIDGKIRTNDQPLVYHRSRIKKLLNIF